MYIRQIRHYVRGYKCGIIFISIIFRTNKKCFIFQKVKKTITWYDCSNETAPCLCILRHQNLTDDTIKKKTASFDSWQQWNWVVLLWLNSVHPSHFYQFNGSDRSFHKISPLVVRMNVYIIVISIRSDTNTSKQAAIFPTFYFDSIWYRV